MPITLERAKQHVLKWTGTFGRYSIEQWPASLFHSAQIEVAVEIIRAGGIICRNKQDKLVCDVANQGALGNNPLAHQYARLYFRPRNSFHLKTEGIKSLTDPNRIDPHMSIPITFVFDFVKLMTSSKVFFTSGNFARTGTAILDGDPAFDGLDFSLIYHDSAPGSRMVEIHNMRMSEVVVPDFLPLTSLSAVICRTTHEARMFGYLLDKSRLSHPNIRVEQRGSIFFRKAIFIDELSIIGGVLNLKFHSPVYHSKENYDITVRVFEGNGSSRVGSFRVPNGAWSFPTLKVRSDAIWQITIEGCLAYEGPVPSSVGLIV